VCNNLQYSCHSASSFDGMAEGFCFESCQGMRTSTFISCPHSPIGGHVRYEVVCKCLSRYKKLRSWSDCSPKTGSDVNANCSRSEGGIVRRHRGHLCVYVRLLVSQLELRQCSASASERLPFSSISHTVERGCQINGSPGSFINNLLDCTWNWSIHDKRSYALRSWEN
jgi:hypothetical protein